MSGLRSRNKGKRAEREIANAYRDAGFEARRGAQHRGSADSPDVEVEELPGMHVEVKAGRSLRLWEAIEQARRDAGRGKVPVVHLRRDLWPTYVVVPFSAWVDVLRDGGEALGMGATARDAGATPVLDPGEGHHSDPWVKRAPARSCEVVHLGETFAIEEDADEGSGSPVPVAGLWCPFCEVGVDLREVTDEMVHDPAAGGCGAGLIVWEGGAE